MHFSPSLTKPGKQTHLQEPMVSMQFEFWGQTALEHSFSSEVQKNYQLAKVTANFFRVRKISWANAGQTNKFSTKSFIFSSVRRTLIFFVRQERLVKSQYASFCKKMSKSTRKRCIRLVMEKFERTAATKNFPENKGDTSQLQIRFLPKNLSSIIGLFTYGI